MGQNLGGGGLGEISTSEDVLELEGERRKRGKAPCFGMGEISTSDVLNIVDQELKTRMGHPMTQAPSPCGALRQLPRPIPLRPAAVLAGNYTSSGKQNGPVADARFDTPTAITVDPAGNVVVLDHLNHALPCPSAFHKAYKA
jgi:hypothetical protein